MTQLDEVPDVPQLQNYAITPQEEQRSKKQLLLLCGSVSIIFTGVWLGIFFDQLYLRTMLEEVYQKQGSSDPSSFANTTYSLVRNVYWLIWLVVSFVAGTYSDHFRSRFGNRSPLVVVGGLITGLSYLFGPFLVLGLGPLVGAMLIYLVIGSALGLIWGGIYGLISDVFTLTERAWAGISITVFSSVGSFLGFTLRFFPTGDSAMVFVGVFILGITVFSFYHLPRHNPTKPPETTFLTDLKNTPKYLLTMRGSDVSKLSFFVLMIVQMCWGATTTILVDYLGLFLLLTEESTSSGLDGELGFIFYSLSFVLVALPVGWLVGHLGKRDTAVVGALVMTTTLLILTNQASWSALSLLILLALLAFSSMIINALRVAMPADLVPEGREGQFMGLSIVTYSFLAPLMGVFVSLIFTHNVNQIDAFVEIFTLIIVAQLISLLLLQLVNYEKQIEEQYIWSYRGVVKTLTQFSETFGVRITRLKRTKLYQKLKERWGEKGFPQEVASL